MPSDYWTVPMIAVSTVFLVICWLTVFLRLYVRSFIVKSVGWDDWVIVLATVRTIMIECRPKTDITPRSSSLASRPVYTRLLTWN